MKTLTLAAALIATGFMIPEAEAQIVRNTARIDAHDGVVDASCVRQIIVNLNSFCAYQDSDDSVLTINFLDSMGMPIWRTVAPNSGSCVDSIKSACRNNIVPRSVQFVRLTREIPNDQNLNGCYLLGMFGWIPSPCYEDHSDMCSVRINTQSLVTSSQYIQCH
jgi:hypothetical protein